MHLGLQAHAGHAQRLAHAFLVIDHVILGQGVQHALVRGNRHGLRGVEHALDVGRAHFTITYGDDTVAVQAADVIASHTDERRVNAATRHQLRLFHRTLDRGHGGFDIDHHALLQPARRMGADTDDFQLAVGRHLAHQRHHLGGADVQANDHLAALRAIH